MVGLDEEGHEGTGEARGGLDDVGGPAFLSVRVEVVELRAGGLGVDAQVVVGAVGDALELAPLAALEAEAVFQVDGALGVVRELLLGVLVLAQVLRVDAEVDVPGLAVVDPVLVPFLIGAGFAEKLEFHLLELAGTEDEVAGRDLVAEGLADLADAERRLLARGVHDVRVVDEDALGGFGAQVVQAGLVVDGAQVGLEQAGEGAGLGPLAAHATVRARDVGGGQGGLFDALLFGELFDELILAGALVAVEALDERVGEGLDVTGGDPHFARENDGGVQAHDVGAAADHGIPPGTLDVFLQFHAERTVVPRGTGATVDVTAGEDEAAALGQADHVVEAGGSLSHLSLLEYLGHDWLSCRH